MLGDPVDPFVPQGHDCLSSKNGLLANMRATKTPSSFSQQVGGSHYKDMAIQPAEYILKNKIGWAEGTAIAYLSRWRQKGGVEDLRKALHTIQLLIEAEGTPRQPT